MLKFAIYEDKIIPCPTKEFPNKIKLMVMAGDLLNCRLSLFPQIVFV